MNSAFEALRRVKDLPSELRTASIDHPLFHQNDPSLINETDNEQESISKPHVVLVSMHSAALDLDDHAVWSDYAFKTNHNLGWDDILLPVGFKHNKPTMMKPPPEYKHKAMESIEPRSLLSPDHLAIQSGLYAAEKLSHAFWISHVITLIVIGQFSFPLKWCHMFILAAYRRRCIFMVV
jgi:hypothetical protein